MNENYVDIYTDGACKGNPGPGGWGAILCYNGREKEIYGSAPETTNNRMELQAVIEALSLLKRACEVRIYTDSRYVQMGMQTWLANWKLVGWRTANKKAVKNVDLWQCLDQLTQKHKVEWHWVKGHNGHPMNERADTLANLGIAQLNNDGLKV